MPALVELAVVRQVHLRRDPEHDAAVDDDRAVVEPVVAVQRGTDHDHRAELAAGLNDLLDRDQHRVQDRVLEEQVVDGVAGEEQLGEDRDGDPVLVAGTCLGEHGGRVRRRVSNRHRRRSGRHAREAVRVGRGEVRCGHI